MQISLLSKRNSPRKLSKREKITNIERPSTSDFWSAVATLRALVLSGADERVLLAEVSKEVKRPKSPID